MSATAADLVRRYILADAAIAAQLGTRFYPLKLPQDVVYPAVTIARVTTIRQPFAHLRGPSALAAPLYQLDVWTKAPDAEAGFRQARDLAELIRQRIDGYAAILEDDTTGTRIRLDVHVADERELAEPDIHGGFYRVSTDYTIWNQPVY